MTSRQKPSSTTPNCRIEGGFEVHPQTRKPCWAVTAVAALICLATAQVPAAAAQLSGDLDQLFEVNAADCVNCTQGQLDELAEGLELALRRLRQEVRAEICFAEASLIRDLAVLTFNELRRSGQISRTRWKDLLKAKATISGGLSNVTKRNLLQRFREDSPPVAGVPQEALDAFAAAQYSRLFLMVAQGRWEIPDWLTGLRSTQGGFGPVIDFLLATSGPNRDELDRVIALSSPGGAWLEGQLWHLTHLPDDFPVDTSGLKAEYAQAIVANNWTAGVNGCGLEAAAGFREMALEIASVLSISRGANMDKNEPVEADDSDIGGADNAGFGETIIVTGTAPTANPGQTGPGGLGGIPGAQGNPTSGPSSPPRSDAADGCNPETDRPNQCSGDTPIGPEFDERECATAVGACLLCLKQGGRANPATARRTVVVCGAICLTGTTEFCVAPILPYEDIIDLDGLEDCSEDDIHGCFWGTP